MTDDRPLAPDEEEYRTDVATHEVAPSGDPLRPESPSAVTSSPPWIVVGLVLLVIFLAILASAVVLPLVR